MNAIYLTAYVYSNIIIVYIYLYCMDVNDREYWIKSMKIIINPIIYNICSNFSNYLHMFNYFKSNTSHFEAFARTFNGISLWLNLNNISNNKELLYHNYIKKCIIISIERYFINSSCCVNFKSNLQYVVEAAFFVQGLLRSWNSIWIGLKNKTKYNILMQLKSTRIFKVPLSNWILFTTMIEIFLLKATNLANTILIESNYYTYMKWYKGDGWYGDGDIFHFDYYNSYVIHPFLLEITLYIEELKLFNIKKKIIVDRYKKFVICLERMINKDGTYPLIGRSITYRFGAFNSLALSVYYNIVPQEISKGMIKRGLTLVLKNFMKYPIFQKNGILEIGLTSGKQKNLGELYISEGSTYLCSFIFIVLGIDESDTFWKENGLTTAEKIWKKML